MPESPCQLFPEGQEHTALTEQARRVGKGGSQLFSISCNTRKNGGKAASRKDGYQEEAPSECLKVPQAVPWHPPHSFPSSYRKSEKAQGSGVKVNVAPNTHILWDLSRTPKVEELEKNDSNSGPAKEPTPEKLG